MVREIIEDSDDEGDFGALSPIACRVSSPNPINSPNERASTHTQKSAPGTSSTEELRRDIAAAHEDVIAKAAIPNGTANSPINIDDRSSPATSWKRKLTLSSLESYETPSRKVDQKNAKTYGQSDQRSHGFFDQDNGAFENIRNEGIRPQTGYSSPSAQPDRTQPSAQKFKDGYVLGGNQMLPELRGSLRRAFAEYDPAIMFPMTMSSTVPDDTISQQRLMEAARAEYQQPKSLSPTGPARNIIENPSVSWSNYLESTENSMRSSQPGSSKSRQPSPKSLEGWQSINHSIPSKAKPGSPSIEIFASPASKTTKKASQRSEIIVYPRLSQSSHDELGDEMPPIAATSSGRRKTWSSEEATLTKSQKFVDESIKESIRAVRASKVARAQYEAGSEPLNSDDIAIDLSKERYVPRPSCSRSVRSNFEEPNYSARPEKAGKGSIKRRTTSESLTPGRCEPSAADKAEKLVSMGYNLAGSEKAPKECGNGLESALDWLLAVGNEMNTAKNEKTGGRPEANTPPIEETGTITALTSATPETGISLPVAKTNQNNTPTQPKRKRGRPPKNRSQQDAGNAVVKDQPQSPSNAAQNSQIDDVDELQGDMPPVKKTRDSEQNVAEDGLLLHDASFVDDNTHIRRPSPIVQPTPTSSARPEVPDVVQDVEEEAKPKKRGRGRPRSTQNVQQPAASNVDESRMAGENHPHDENKKSQERVPNTSLGKSKWDDKQEAARRREEAMLGAPPDAINILGSGSSEQRSEKHEVETAPKATRKAASAQPSPLGKGNVPVRVGLSRKARIAPLLKMVKK